MLSIVKEVRMSYDKICGVCGDLARCINYGGISCESCKTFFRRAHINKTYKIYQCMDNSNCFIDAGTRKYCQACRYRRCLENGMDPKCLKSEKDKTADLARKRSRNSFTSTRDSNPNTVSNPIFKLDPRAVKLSFDDKSKFFNMMEILDLDNLTSKYATSFYDIPFTEDTIHLKDDILKAGALITETIQRLFFFSYLVPQFRELDLHDQVILLSQGAADLSLLNAVLSYDSIAQRWPRPGCQLYRTSTVKRRDLSGVVGVDYCDIEIQYIMSMQYLRPDEQVLMLLFLLILFHPGRENLKNPVAVAKHQMYFARLFKNYLDWRYGGAHGAKLFQGFIGRLTELRLTNNLANGMYRFFETHPEMKEMKCCRTFFAVAFAENGVCIHTVLN